MSFKCTTSFLPLSCLVLVALVATSLQAATIVDDNFTDGDRAATGPLEADFYASSNSNAIESNVGSVGLVSGSSGRQIHGIFPTQTLANTGDSLFTSFSFTTPPTTASGGEDIRFGIFDHLGRDNASQLGQDTSYSSSSPNDDYKDLPGYYSELDVENADSGTNLNIRRSNPSGHWTSDIHELGLLKRGQQFGHRLRDRRQRTTHGDDLGHAYGGWWSRYHHDVPG